ncbi:MAG: 1-deoxy-D-xylulose-5-phosphate reductoisomerase [Thermodesulfobacteriota bacterium]
MKNISLLGSTGSIGVQTLDVISQHGDKFNVLGLSAGRNIDLLRHQINKFKPSVVSVLAQEDALKLSKELSGKSIEVLYGSNGANEVATIDDVDMVVSAMVGASGLEPTLKAVNKGKDIALANKETLVIAGELITNQASKKNVKIIPVDSEHSAIFQVLSNSEKNFVKRIILTASGGPFLGFSEEELKKVTVESALNHPTWKMGEKITIDSATLMNKAFEIIEARWIFNMPQDKISVCIHPQSIIHSMVEFIDGSILSQMSIPDMRIPISYALSHPNRISLNIQDGNNLPKEFSNLSLENADEERFTALKLARKALENGGTLPAVMNGANEVAVNAFLNRKIKFIDILIIVEKVMNMHNNSSSVSYEAIKESDKWARNTTEQLLNQNI